MICHGGLMMRWWLRLLLVVLLAGLLVQCFLYLNGHQYASSINIDSASSILITREPNQANFNKYTLSINTSRKANNDAVESSIVNPHPFSFIINEPNACKPTTLLVIVVITSVNNFEERQAVRETWGSYAAVPSHNTTLVFLLGNPQSEELQLKLFNESKHFHDLLQEDFVDSYRNLSIKSVALLKWVSQYCNFSRYTLKADDDMYVNVPNLIEALMKESKSDFIMGHVFVGAKPVHNKQSKWYTSMKEFNETEYPRYTSGTAYAMTTKTAPSLFKACLQVPFFWLEDIFVTGLCARKAGVTAVHLGGFNYVKIGNDPCTFRHVITGHQYDAVEKRAIHKALIDKQLKCQ